ncbi:type 1 periplasmic-binding domain-containing protein [Desulfogranum japonicum]|uniref:ABC transporter substrate-binding protein n=1 Tax=Desulfogranum japonicum TaxID=231447 RepID=UPI0004146086|nr:ABC transporter substrate-binding protein [Desulfogranum japonicum]
MRNKFILLLFAILPFVAVVTVFFWGDKPSPEEKRAQTLASLSSDSTIEFGILWSDTEGGDAYRMGVELAVDEINSHGGLLGHKVATVYQGISSGYLTNMNAVHALKERPNLCVILGLPPFKTTPLHLGLSRYYGLPCILNSQDNVLLLRKWHQDLVVRGNSSSKAIARKLVKKCRELELNNVVLIRRASEYDYFYEELANYTTNLMLVEGILVDSYVLDSTDTVSDQNLALERFNFAKKENTNLRQGAVVLSADQRELLGIATYLMEKTAIEAAISFLDFSSIDIRKHGKKLTGLKKQFYVITDYLEKEELQKEQFKSFITNYYKRYESYPTNWSVAGYDQAQLVAQAIRTGQSFLPRDIIAELKKTPFSGIGQLYSFGETGELTQPTIHFFQANKLPRYAEEMRAFAESLGIDGDLVQGFFHDFSEAQSQ